MVIVLRFYSEIHQNDRKSQNFVLQQRPDINTIEKFMTEDEFNLSKKNLKINARALKENDNIT